MTRYVGKIGLSTATEIAERAIIAADEMACTSQAKFAMYVDEKARFHVAHWLKGWKAPQGWIATFNRKSDPDWLAEEIEGAT